ncbi:MAG: tRNA (uridine(34)/cytosine(34)/5-carboxymethylaminomethyluridine(34)-2'-O)-methyltransferase TrmL [Pseudomonadota bacterium]
MFHVVLHQPEIPPNTGNIIRLCANTGMTLHLIEPLGFDLDEKRLRRAGLDYREFADVNVHADWDAYRRTLTARRWLFTTKATRCFSDADYESGDALVFGCETAGLPAEIREGEPSTQLLRLPMVPSSRSLNLSNSVAVAVYEAWRQHGYPGNTLPQGATTKR